MAPLTKPSKAKFHQYDPFHGLTKSVKKFKRVKVTKKDNSVLMLDHFA